LVPEVITIALPDSTYLCTKIFIIGECTIHGTKHLITRFVKLRINLKSLLFRYPDILCTMKVGVGLSIGIERKTKDEE
ncbi:MAG TPA: hypothetical protein VHO70_09835, partial [Chitinispirillaceae bacterium]|nr:hypothetical protein [Chitinispirillaceae bacterium]